MLASAAGVQLQVPSQLEATARKWWRSAGNGAPVSLSHAKVASRLRALGLAPEVCPPLLDLPWQNCSPPAVVHPLVLGQRS